MINFKLFYHLEFLFDVYLKINYLSLDVLMILVKILIISFISFNNICILTSDISVSSINFSQYLVSLASFAEILSLAMKSFFDCAA